MSSRAGRRALFSLAIAALLASPALAGEPAASSPSYDALVEAAIDARQSGDLAGSAELLRKAHALEPSPELMNNLGRVLEELGKYLEAFETYRSVANDPTADRSLRALDAGRMAALQPRIGRAWIVLTITPEDATVFLDGASVGATAAGGEHATGPARTTLEFHMTDAAEVVLRQPAPPIGERSVHFEDVGTIAPTDARLDFAGITPAPTAVVIDGQALMGDLTRRPMVRLPAGEHLVGVTLPGYEPEEHLVTLEPDAEVAIAPLLVRRTRVAVDVWEDTPAPWITTIAGLATIGVGAGLLAAASAEQAAMGNPSSTTGVVETMTQREAEALNESAQTYGTAGVASLLVGASAAITGVIWWLLHESDRPYESDTPSVWVAPTGGGAAAGMTVAW